MTFSMLPWEITLGEKYVLNHYFRILSPMSGTGYCGPDSLSILWTDVKPFHLMGKISLPEECGYWGMRKVICHLLTAYLAFLGIYNWLSWPGEGAAALCLKRDTQRCSTPDPGEASVSPWIKKLVSQWKNLSTGKADSHTRPVSDSRDKHHGWKIPSTHCEFLTKLILLMPSSWPQATHKALLSLGLQNQELTITCFPLASVSPVPVRAINKFPRLTWLHLGEEKK